MSAAETQQCIFCKIISGEIPSFKVYEDDKCVAVLDINPATKGHLLLMPKQHYAYLAEMPEELVAHLGQVSKWLAHSAIKLFSATGISIFSAIGAVAGQNAPHAIIHIIPRYEGDAADLMLKRTKVAAESLSKLKEALAQSLKKELGYTESKPQKEEEAQKQEKVEKPKEETEAKPDLDSITALLSGGEGDG
ncbi:HIT family protein [Candidatus Woesearchaeota archaeon]|nr:HIT family protein [Candidatus Woesearchaeota archaeon]RLE43431.1 MAG: HIT family protein [Candidatus Woesearchaeota archaeon]